MSPLLEYLMLYSRQLRAEWESRRSAFDNWEKSNDKQRAPMEISLFLPDLMLETKRTIAHFHLEAIKGLISDFCNHNTCHSGLQSSRRVSGISSPSPSIQNGILSLLSSYFHDVFGNLAVSVLADFK